MALFADLLGIPTAIPEAIAAMSPLQKKGLLFRTFLAQLEGLAARGAVLIVLEDAHRLDPTSRELFDQIVDRLQRLPVLLVVTFRPELSPPWIGFPHVTLLTLMGERPQPLPISGISGVREMRPTTAPSASTS